jgi:S-adenosylmethionine/arginine decarboxylase-like enzyme
MAASTVTEKYWGYHLTLDCAGCNVENMKSHENIVAFFDELISVTKMQKWGEPLIQDLQTGPEHIRGISAVQFIATSSITCHFCDFTGECYIDFFSCKSFVLDDVVACVKKYFGAQHVKQQYLIRNAVQLAK